jgi:type II secretory pathway pseudopilin PulG
MLARKATSGGWLLTETVVGLALIGTLLAGLAVTQNGFRKFNGHQLVRQRCIAAGQAELDSMTATGQPIGEDDFNRLWPGLSARIQETPGEGDWAGLKLVQVVTSGSSYGRTITVRLSRYVAVRQGP